MIGPVELTLPYPPSVNEVWVHTPNGVKLSEKAEAYRAKVVLRCKAMRVRTLAGPVFCDVSLYRPRKKGDMDNAFKALFDALTHGEVWLDDEQACEMRVIRLTDPDDPRVVVRLTGERWATQREIQEVRQGRFDAAVKRRQTLETNRKRKKSPSFFERLTPALWK